MWWAYPLVFVSALAVDAVPIISPPDWTVMILLLMKFDLNPWVVLVVGVLGSALGRFVLSLYVAKLSNRIIKRRKNEELEFVGKKLGEKNWRSWLFVFVYTLTPLSSTPIFTAAGIAKINPLQIIPPFFCGKFISDAVMVFTGRYAVSNLADLIHGTFSMKGIVTAVAGLMVIAALLFIDWRAVLVKKKFKFNPRIWK